MSMLRYVFLGMTPLMTGGGIYSSVCDSEYNAVEVSLSSSSEEDLRR